MKRIIAVTVVVVARRGLVRRRHVVGTQSGRCARERARRNRLHLPDAPGLPQRPSRQLPDLRHVARGGTSGRGGRRRGTNDALPHGSVQVSPDRQQAIGVRLGVVSRVAATRLLRTTGRVAADENRTYPIVAAVSGWIRNVESVTTGDAVKKDQVLASFLAPEVEFRSAQQSYYTGLEAFYRMAVTSLSRSHSASRSRGGTPRARRGGDRPDGR